MKRTGKGPLVTGVATEVRQAIALTFATAGAPVSVDYSGDENGFRRHAWQIAAAGGKSPAVVLRNAGSP